LRKAILRYHVDRLIPSASHGRCAGRRGMIPCARRQRSLRRRLRSRGVIMHLCKLLTNVFAMSPAPGRRRLLSRLLGIYSPVARHPQNIKGSFRELRGNLKLAPGGLLPRARRCNLKGYEIDGRSRRGCSADFSASGLKHQDNDLIVIESAEAAGAKRAFDTRFASGGA